MKAVIPAAGTGTRLRPLTAEKPKALVEVAGTPMLTDCLEQLLDLPIDEVVVIVGYRGQQIVDRYGESFRGLPLTYVWQDDQRGLGHAVLQAREQVDETFLLLNGDNVVRANVGDLITTQQQSGVDGAGLVTTVSPEKARESGVVVVEDERVVDVVEKPADPPSLLVNSGCYVLPPAVFQACDLLRPGTEGEYQLSDAVGVLCRAGYEFVPVQLDGWRVNVNSQADIDRATERLRERD